MVLADPLHQNFFIFMHIGKNWPNNILAPHLGIGAPVWEILDLPLYGVGVHSLSALRNPECATVWNSIKSNIS